MSNNPALAGESAQPDSPGDLPDALFPAADEIFGPELSRAERYATLLATDGVVRGLIGPREAPRIWSRHILNCAVVAELIPSSAFVVDVGSGAGLPGIPLALARPDIEVVLVEPLLRRVTFLDEVIDRLGLGDQVTVQRGRAEELISMFHVKPADVATARALAPLDRLAGWTLPLVRVGGRVLALKGESARAEMADHARVIESLGGRTPEIHSCGDRLLDEPATVVEIVRQREFPTRPARPAKSRRRNVRG